MAGGGILLLLVVVYWVLLHNLYPFLALSKKLDDAGILVVEGWIDNKNLMLAKDEFEQHNYQQIVVSSTSFPISFTTLEEGTLKFDFMVSPYKTLTGVQELTLLAFGVSEDDHYPRFSLVLNDSITLDRVQTTSKLTSYTYDIASLEYPIEKILLKYEQDSSQQMQHDSLFVHSMLLDDLTVPGWAHNVKYLKDDRKSTKIQTYSNHYTDADVTKEIMLHYGVPSDKIVAVSTQKDRLNRTYSSAETAARWISAHYDPVPAINIFTEGVHARRSFILYQLAFDKQVKLGVIASPKYKFNRKNWWKEKEGREYVLTQTMKYIYAKFLFYPYKEISAKPIPADTARQANATVEVGR